MAASSLKDNVHVQRAALSTIMMVPMSELAEAAALIWGQREALDELLLKSITNLPHCKFVYAMGPNAVQVSSNATPHDLIEADFRRDRSQRPYMTDLDKDLDFNLSESYISLRERRPTITAVQSVMDGEHLLGYIGADFNLRDMPFADSLYEEPKVWRQVKGDPAIRGSIFDSVRVDSLLDDEIDTIQSVLEELYLERGLFHGKIHFSSSRATIWLMDDPYRYRILDFEALIDPDICMAFPKRPYPENAATTKEQVRTVFRGLRALRYMDENIYLRAGSLNIMNGMVGLTFSCDGSHYMPVEEFLDKDLEFWEGTAADDSQTPCV